MRFTLKWKHSPLVKGQIAEPEMGSHSADPEDEKTLLNFGDPVDDPEFCDLMRSRLYDQLGSTSSPHIFPGGQPVSFESRHLSILETEDYYVCEKSDGVRYLLYFCSPPSGPAAFLIDRNYVFRYLGPLVLPGKDLKTPHEETLLDGELLVDTYEDVVETKGVEKVKEDIYDLDGEKEEVPKKTTKKRKVTSFMIFDCLLVNGRNVIHESLPNRLKHVQNDVIHPFNQLKLKDSFPFLVQMKTMYKPYHMQHLFAEVIPKLAHENDGLIFTPVEDPYRSGTCQRMLKWKPAHLNSVDFKLVKSEDSNGKSKFTLQVAQSGQHKDYAPFRPEPEDAESWNVNPPLGKILECRYDPEWIVDEKKPGGWRFIRFREDKVMANAQHVVQKIIDSIGDNVKQDHLIKSCDRIKKNWDLRHPEESKPKRPKI